MSEQQADYTTKNQPEQTWVILEAMGHTRVAGRYYFENGLHRVDIPDPGDPDRFVRTERFGPSAIFRITSVNQEVAIAVAAKSQIPDAIPWDIRHELKQLAVPKYQVIEQYEEEVHPANPDAPY